MAVIDLSCSSCGQRLRVPIEHAGKRAKCPKCGEVLQIPAADTAPAPPTSQTTVSTTPASPPSTAGQAATAAAAWYLKIPEGDTFGPVSRSELDRWRQEGRIDADCHLAQGEPQVWRPATEVFADLAAPIPTLDPAGARLATSPQLTESEQLAPHRGTLVLILGLLGLTVCGAATGLPAWLLASRDLREMRAGRMDRSGEQLTTIGQVLGIVSLVLTMIGLLGFVLLVALGFQG
mgnify:CR=1 FL=1